MFTEANIADLLLRHHNVNPDDASLAANLILDEHQKTHRPLSDLIEASKLGFPSFYRKADAAPAVPTKPSSLTQRVALAGDGGALDPDVIAAIQKLRSGAAIR